MDPALFRSRALWNRSTFDLNSDETLAQILDRGEMESWRELYRLSRTDAVLRKRILHVLQTVPIGMPFFWMAALESLGEAVDYAALSPVPFDADWT